MPTTYLTPGVYVEEIPSASKPIEGVGTAVAAFVGLAPGGPVNKAMRISNWSQFARLYSDPLNPDNGPFMEGAYLAHAVYGFFQNGGNLAWIIRVGKEGRGQLPRAALPAAADQSVEAFRAVALPGVSAPVTVEVTEEPPTPETKEGEPTYTVIVTAGTEREEYPGVSAAQKKRGNLATKVNSASKLIKIDETGASLPDNRIAAGTYTLSAPPSASEAISAAEFEGDVPKRQGMGGLAPLDEVTRSVMPDIMTLNSDGKQMRDLQGKMIAHCETAGGKMAILDAPAGLLPQDVLEWRMNIARYDSKYAALYYPWIEVMDPIKREPLMIPPSGHMAGLWSRVDSGRGVHKAPANEVVLGANDLEFQVSHAEQGELNRTGINCIRAFPGRGIRVWGARTLSSDPEWRYINVRRIFNYVSVSFMLGTQWAVFEPNDQRLWTSLTITISNFLNRTWRSGALFGTSASDAYFVKCDAETNPPEVIEAGQVVCEIGIAPVKPAEFVIFRLSQFTGGAGATRELA
jgi:phage tail sheath protein FI